MIRKTVAVLSLVAAAVVIGLWFTTSGPATPVSLATRLPLPIETPIRLEAWNGDLWVFWGSARTAARVPLWIPLVLCLLYPSYAILSPRLESISRRLRRCCVKCGYPLTGLAAARCPECGKVFSPEAATGIAITLRRFVADRLREAFVRTIGRLALGDLPGTWDAERKLVVCFAGSAAAAVLYAVLAFYSSAIFGALAENALYAAQARETVLISSPPGLRAFVRVQQSVGLFPQSVEIASGTLILSVAQLLAGVLIVAVVASAVNRATRPSATELAYNWLVTALLSVAVLPIGLGSLCALMLIASLTTGGRVGLDGPDAVLNVFATAPAAIWVLWFLICPPVLARRRLRRPCRLL